MNDTCLPDPEQEFEVGGTVWSHIRLNCPNEGQVKQTVNAVQVQLVQGNAGITGRSPEFEQ